LSHSEGEGEVEDDPEADLESPEAEPESPEVEPESPEAEPESPEAEPESPEAEPESPEAEPESPEAVSPLEQPGQAHAHEEDSKQLETDPEVNIFFVQLFRVISGIEIGNL
jgi:hypothetical protein